MAEQTTSKLLKTVMSQIYKYCKQRKCRQYCEVDSIIGVTEDHTPSIVSFPQQIAVHVFSTGSMLVTVLIYAFALLRFYGNDLHIYSNINTAARNKYNYNIDRF